MGQVLWTAVALDDPPSHNKRIEDTAPRRRVNGFAAALLNRFAHQRGGTSSRARLVSECRKHYPIGQRRLLSDDS
jgi:hypothetical protein